MKRLLIPLMMLCILLSFSAAFAAEWPDVCPYCGHTDLKWYSVIDEDGNDVHTLICKSCGSPVSDYEVCTPDEGTATCTMPALCKVCGIPMFSTMSPDPDKHDLTEVDYWWNILGFGEDGIPIYKCSAQISCKNCIYSEQASVLATHAITTAPTCTEPGILTYTAVFEEEWAQTQSNDQLAEAAPLSHTSVTDEAVPPTCTETGLTEGAHCGVCGKILKPQYTVPALGHQYISETTAPACNKPGCVTCTCTVCGDSYVSEIIPAWNHHYALWTPKADNSHSAPCRRCNHTRTNDCTFFEVTAADGETIHTVCPVCGSAGETAYEVLPNAKIVSATGKKLPYGEAIVRGAQAPFEGVLYAFTAAYEFAGNVVPYGTTVSVSLPLDTAQFPAFELLYVDVTAATETAARTEVLTAVPFTCENGVLTFQADTAALYLIIAK